MCLEISCIPQDVLMAIYICLVVVACFGLWHLRTGAITTRPLLNASEARLFPILRSITAKHLGAGYAVYPQVACGEFLTTSSVKTRYLFNARRADFLIVDPAFNPVAVIEYQGSGHYGSSIRSQIRARKGDRIKRRVIRRAGLVLIEVPPRFDSHALVELMRRKGLFRG